MDLVRVETRSEIMFSFLSVGWGLIADIDIESEPLRPIGPQRFTVWSLHRLISLRTYHGRISYALANCELSNHNSGVATNKLNALKHSISCNTALDCPECHGEGDCETCDTGFGDILSLETTSGTNSFRPRGDSWYSATSRRSTYFSASESVYQSINDKHSEPDSSFKYDKSTAQMFGPASTIPALTAPVPSTWKSEEGEFVLVHTAYQTHLGSDCFFAPHSKLNDGIIWLVIIRAGVSRSQLLSFLLGLSSGTHIPETKSPFIEIIPVTAFRFEPSGTQGNITVDGESVEYGPIQGEVFPGISRVMAPVFS
ncbi:unnamed protein product [Hermetia illucens]|uniref:YegS/DAGK C-terminal domain-containing protein n=3 Tax=Hermetia illucens TaxID=343691 RepID=A0A7R8UHE6_HERIL|nr:unnamed protein product [Hermetia illucens]